VLGFSQKEMELASIKLHVARALTVGALGVATAAAFMLPASASQATAAHMSAVSTVHAAAAKKPNSDITGSGKTVVYSPTTLKAKWSGKKEGTCTTAKESFTISNTTKTSETVTLSGKTFAKVPADKVLGVCAWGTGTTTGVFGLKANKKATLTVDVS
jgi:hypothetical protein